jgi:L-fuconolactonase
MVTEAGPDWQSADLQPFAKHVLGTFGPGRIMFGSDWPVVNLASDYSSWIQFVRSAIAAFSDQEQAQIIGGTAAAFYRL